jgi:hypothetical protein
MLIDACTGTESFGSGSFRILEGTGGCGRRAATWCSTSRLLWCPGGIEQRPVVLGRQVWRQESNGRQRERAILEQAKDNGKPPCRTCGFDPAVCRVFRQAQDARAVDEQGRTAFAEVQPPCVDFRECRDESRRRGAFAVREPYRHGEQGLIRQV